MNIKIIEPSKNDISSRLMNQWRKYAKDYRNLIPRYNELIELKKAKGIKPLAKLSVEVLRKFPKIPFFEIKTEKVALAYLDQLTNNELETLNTSIDVALDSYQYRSLTSWISYSEDQVWVSESPKVKLGKDPNYHKSVGKMPATSARYGARDEI